MTDPVKYVAQVVVTVDLGDLDQTDLPDVPDWTLTDLVRAVRLGVATTQDVPMTWEQEPTR